MTPRAFNQIVHVLAKDRAKLVDLQVSARWFGNSHERTPAILSRIRLIEKRIAFNSQRLHAAAPPIQPQP